MGVVLHRDRAARARAALLGTSALVAASLAFIAPAAAQDATWNTTPGSGDFFTASNWTPAAVPSGFATFGNSSITTLTFSGSRNIDGFIFQSGAPAYTFNLTSGFGLAFHTDGIVNNSSNAPIFNVNNSPLTFDDSSTAGNAIINLTAGTVVFSLNATPGSAQLNAVNAGTVFDFSGTAGPAGDDKISAGSISGAGNFALGANTLTVGSNNLSTEVSGNITGNALIKVGTGTLTLSNINVYFGGTTISEGTIVANRADTFGLDTFITALGNGTITLDGGELRFGVDGQLLNFVTLSAGKTSIISAGSNEVTLGPLSLDTGATVQFGRAGDTGTVLLSQPPSADTSNSVIVAGGTLKDGGSQSLTGLTFYASTTVNAGATLDFDASDSKAIRNLSGAGTVLTGTDLSVPLILFVDDGTSSTFAGTISGAGKVLIESYTVSDGRMIFTGANNYTGGTEICGCSTLQLGTTTTAGSIIGDVTVFGNLDVINSDTSGITSITNDGGTTTFLNGQSASSIAIENRFGGATIFATAFGTDTATAGNATIVNRSGGYTEFNANSTAGNATITNRYGGETNFWDNSTAGTATIVNRYFGTLNFYDNSSADGATITNRYGAETSFYDNSTAGNATITNRYGGVLIFADSSTAGNATITNSGSGSIAPGLIFLDSSTAGTATIQNNSSGFIAFGLPFGFDSPSADHATITNSGLIQFNAFSTAASATITTNNAGGVFFFDNATGGAAQFITNAGGTADFSQTIGPDGDKKITAGSIAGAGDYYLGGIQFTVGSNNLSTTVSGTINDGVSPLLQSLSCGCGLITETGASLVKEGTGTLILSGTNTYTGNTTILAGVLQLGDGGATGTILGNVLDNATLAFNRSNTYTFAGVISGSGTVEQNGPGTTVFTAANSYTGGTIINAGTLQLGPGGSLAPTGALRVNLGGIFDLNSHIQTVGDFSGAGNVFLGSGTLTAGTANNTVFSGVMSGSGGFTKVGTGTTTFSGASTYDGPTAVNAGTLIVNGSLVSAVTVNPGATLGGNGSVGATTINGGTLSPGNSIDTITVASLTFVGAGNYLVEVSPAAADRTNVTGAATLAGTIQIAASGGLYTPKRYVVINANSVSGTFGAISITGSFGAAVRNPHVEYDANNVYFVLDANAISPFLVNGTVNQRSVAGALDAAFATGNAPAQFLGLFNLPASVLPGALTQLSGEIGTAAPTAAFQTMDQFLQVMLDPFLETRLGDGTVQGRALSFAPESSIQAALPAQLLAYNGIVTKAPAMAAPDRRYTVWGVGYGASGRFGGDAAIGSNNLTISNGSFAAGIDFRAWRDTTIGIAVSGGSYNYGLGSLGSGRGDVVQGGLYGSTRFLDNAYLSAAFAYGRHDVATERTVSFGGTFDRLSANFNANGWGGRVETGYRFALTNWLGVTPFAAVQAQRFETPAYAERDLTGLGLAGFGLNYSGRNTDETRSEIGARIDHRIVLDSALLTLRARAAWGHEFSTDRSAVAAFQGLPGFGFTVIGAAQPRDVAIVSTGAELKLRNGVALRAKFDGEFSGRSSVYAGSGGLYFSW